MLSHTVLAGVWSQSSRLVSWPVHLTSSAKTSDEVMLKKDPLYASNPTQYSPHRELLDTLVTAYKTAFAY